MWDCVETGLAKAITLVKMRYIALTLVVVISVAVIAHGVMDWRWSHADFKRLFTATIRSQIANTLRRLQLLQKRLRLSL